MMSGMIESLDLIMIMLFSLKIKYAFVEAKPFFKATVCFCNLIFVSYWIILVKHCTILVFYWTKYKIPLQLVRISHSLIGE